MSRTTNLADTALDNRFKALAGSDGAVGSAVGLVAQLNRVISDAAQLRIDDPTQDGKDDIDDVMDTLKVDAQTEIDLIP